MSDKDDNDIDLRVYLRALVRYRWVILLAAIVVGGVVTMWTLRQPKVYEAVTTIEYDPNPARPLGGDVADLADPIGSFWTTQEYFNTQNRILRGRHIAELVVQRLNLQRDTDGDVTRAAISLQRRIEIVGVRDTRLVEIRVRDTNARRAQRIANTLFAVYEERTVEDRRSRADMALEKLLSRRERLRVDLEASETSLHQFKRDHDILSVSMEDQQNGVAAQYRAFSEALTSARTRRIELSARADRLRAAEGVDPLQASTTVLETNPAITSLRQQLRTKLAEQSSMSTRYGANHPLMRATTEEIEALEEQLRQEILLVVAAAVADLREARHVEAGLAAALRQAHEAGLELNLREIEYQRVNRERANMAELYSLVLTRTTQTEIARDEQITSVRQEEAAIEPTEAVSPNVPLNIAGGLLGGLLLGLGLAVGLAFVDRRLKSPADVEELGLSVIGILPDIGMPEQEKSRRGRRRNESIPDNRDMVAHTHPMSAASECCRTIRTNLMFMSPDAPIRAFAVTSPTPQEGKTTVACNIAISLSQSGKSVLLVDTDLRRPRVHKSFGLSGAEGITSVLVGEKSLESAVQASPVERLSILACGPIPPNPSELLHGRSFRELLAKALTIYDRVIFDSPPLGAVTDAAVLAPQLDGVLVVVKAEKTTRDGLRSAMRQLTDVNARILGCVVNGVDLAAGTYGGGGYYAYYRADYYAEDEPEDVAAE